MVITYQGETYFKIQAGDLIVLVDPNNHRPLKGANLIINTLKPTLIDSLYKPFIQKVDAWTDGSILWIDHQGEYEIKGIEVRGWGVEHNQGVEKTVYRLIIDGIVIAVLGRIERRLSENFQEYLRGTDIVLGPAIKTGSWVRQLEPKIIVPALSGKDLDVFLKEIGETKSQLLEKLVVKKKDIVPNKVKIICLSS